jgi:GNAT superfamily N-acetyltransferase
MELKTINKTNRYYYEIINNYYKWWGKDKSKSLKEIDEFYNGIIVSDDLPIIRALIINDTLIGFYELNAKDDIDEEEYTPYLANVFVKEQYRKQGYSSYLINDAKELAKNMGYEKLYLHSHLEDYYEKYDFKFLKEVNTKLGKKRIYVYKIKE